jgi:hypothetical protein
MPLTLSLYTTGGLVGGVDDSFDTDTVGQKAQRNDCHNYC